MPRYTYCLYIEDTRPIRQKVISYPPDARQWLTEYLEAEVDKMVFRKIDINHEPEPTFIRTIVLVPGVQSNHKYQVYAYLMEANACIWSSSIYLSECIEVLDMVGHVPIFSAHIIKSGFHNILVVLELQRFSGVVN